MIITEPESQYPPDKKDPYDWSTQHDHKTPEDEVFDHSQIETSGQFNLVRGASTKYKTTSQYDSSWHPPVYDDYNPYTIRARAQNEGSNASLVHNAADMGRSDNYQRLEYADPHNSERSEPDSGKMSSFQNFFGTGRYPMEQRIENKKRGIGRQKHPLVVWTLTAVMTAVFIYELGVNWKAQGTPFSFKPVVNYMLGPSSSALINVGARFPPCMKLVEDIPPTILLPCLNDTANPIDQACSVETLCNFGGFHGQDPNQWFRFITPIFLHAGLIHILLNMFAQLTLSAQIERDMGSGGFFLTYFAAGIFGNVLGGNFARAGVPSVGASGAIFGTIAVTWVDLFAHWKYHYRPGRKLAWMTVDLVIGVAVGYIPYVDNFAHLGGFLMGLLVGTTLYPVISITKRHRAITWGVRLVAIPLAIILFVVLTRNFYTSNPYAACSGCRYLSCFPTASNNHCQGNGLVSA